MGGFLTQLEVLDLLGNDLTGTIPQELGRIKALEKIHVDANCRLGGTVPTSFRRLLLKNLDDFSFTSTSISIPNGAVSKHRCSSSSDSYDDSDVNGTEASNFDVTKELQVEKRTQTQKDMRENCHYIKCKMCCRCLQYENPNAFFGETREYNICESPNDDGYKQMETQQYGTIFDILP